MKKLSFAAAIIGATLSMSLSMTPDQPAVVGWSRLLGHVGTTQRLPSTACPGPKQHPSTDQRTTHDGPDRGVDRANRDDRGEAESEEAAEESTAPLGRRKPAQ